MKIVCPKCHLIVDHIDANVRCPHCHIKMERDVTEIA